MYKLVLVYAIFLFFLFWLLNSFRMQVLLDIIYHKNYFDYLFINVFWLRVKNMFSNDLKKKCRNQLSQNLFIFLLISVILIFVYILFFLSYPHNHFDYSLFFLLSMQLSIFTVLKCLYIIKFLFIELDRLFVITSNITNVFSIW